MKIKEILTTQTEETFKTNRIMKKMKLSVFVFVWFCTALLVNILISVGMHFSTHEYLSSTNFTSLLYKDLVLSAFLILVLYAMLHKQLKETFAK